MDKETVNTIGKWAVIIVCALCAAFFANKGNMEAAGGFGFGAGFILYLSFIRDTI